MDSTGSETNATPRTIQNDAAYPSPGIPPIRVTLKWHSRARATHEATPMPRPAIPAGSSTAGSISRAANGG